MTLATPLAAPRTSREFYNQSKTKTFFFWSQEWRRDRLPYTFNQLVPTVAERSGNFTDICNLGPADCPIDQTQMLRIQETKSRLVPATPT